MSHSCLGDRLDTHAFGFFRRCVSFVSHRASAGLPMGPQGIFKPRVLRDIPLSITTVAVVEGETRPYDDAFGEDGLLRYRAAAPARVSGTRCAGVPALLRGLPPAAR